MLMRLIIVAGTIIAAFLLFVIALVFGGTGCVVFICALAALGLVYMILDLRKRIDIIKNGVTAQASLDTSKSLSDYLMPEAKYIYTAEDGKKYEFKKEFTVLNPNLYAQPEITVYYKPDKPQVSVHRSCIGMRIIYLICYIILAALVISCFAVVFLV